MYIHWDPRFKRYEKSSSLAYHRHSFEGSHLSIFQISPQLLFRILSDQCICFHEGYSGALFMIIPRRLALIRSLSRFARGAPFEWLKGNDIVVFMGRFHFRMISMGHALLLKPFLLQAESIQHHSIEHLAAYSDQKSIAEQWEDQGRACSESVTVSRGSRAVLVTGREYTSAL